MIFGTSPYCHENTSDVEIEQNVYEFIQNQVINMTSVAMTTLNSG